MYSRSLQRAVFYLPYLSYIYKKAHRIAIFWTGHPHSLGSCYFRDVWATCLPHKSGGVPLSALSKDTTTELAGLFSTSPECRAPSKKAVDTIFKVFWYDSTRGLSPRSTDCEADALTTTPSRRFYFVCRSNSVNINHTYRYIIGFCKIMVLVLVQK